MDPAVALLRDLVAIDSVNPALIPGASGEAAVAQRLAEELHALGLEVHVSDAAPGRPNVVAVLEGRRAGRTLMLCGHTDTVGVAGMPAPFEPVIRDGRLYGRGAQDMKGGLAAMVGAVRRVQEAGGLLAGRLIVAAVVDEEHASLGADALVRDWTADAAVVAEPTGLDVAVAHKGFQWVEVTVRGRAAHGSRPEEGRDAILRMGRVLQELDRLNRALQQSPPHPRLGRASLHASAIDGGRELSSYPDRCTLRFERRTLPGEAADAALGEALDILDRLHEEDAEFEAEARPVFGRAAHEIAPDHPLVPLLAKAARAAGGRGALVGTSFWTDAAILADAGIPAVVFGPGGAGLHGLTEYVVIDDVCRCRDALAALAQTFTQAAAPPGRVTPRDAR